MPQIPVYEQRVQEQKTPGFRESGATAESFGSGTGAALQKLGAGASDFFQETAKFAAEKKKAAVFEAYSKAQDEAREFLHGANGIYARRGKEATNVYDESKQKLDEIKQKYVADLDNDQRELFLHSYDTLRDEHLNRVVGFQDKATLQYEADSLDAMNHSAVSDAIAGRTDPGAIAKAEDTISKNTAYKNRGAESPIKDRAVQEAIDHLHSQVLGSIEADSPTAALNYLEANKAKFLPEKLDTMKKSLEEKGKIEFAMVTARKLDSSGLPLEEQIKQAEKLDKPADVKEKLIAQIKEIAKDKETSKEIERKKIADSEIDAIRKDPSGYVVPSGNMYDAATQERLLELQKKFKNPEMSTHTDPATYLKLSQMKVEEFKKTNLLDYVKGLSIDDFKHFADLQKKDDNTYKNAQNLTSFVGEMVKARGLKDDKNFGEISYMRQAFEDELNKYPPDQRDKLETWNKIKDAMFIDTAPWYRSAKPLYKARMEGEEAVPAEKPKNVPEGAVWVNKNVGNGVPYRGWEYTNKAGVKYLIGVDGAIYQVKQ